MTRLVEKVGAVPRGAPYVARDPPHRPRISTRIPFGLARGVDVADDGSTACRLCGNTPSSSAERAIAPRWCESRDRPFRVRVRLEPFDLDVRMESWLPTDTIRRAGFGHVIVNGRHELTLERGISFGTGTGRGDRLRLGPLRADPAAAPRPRVRHEALTRDL